MKKTSGNKKICKEKVANNKAINDYANDRYFFNKRKIASKFLKKAGFPDLTGNSKFK